MQSLSNYNLFNDVMYRGRVVKIINFPSNDMADIYLLSEVKQIETVAIRELQDIPLTEELLSQQGITYDEFVRSYTLNGIYFNISQNPAQIQTDINGKGNILQLSYWHELQNVFSIELMPEFACSIS